MQIPPHQFTFTTRYPSLSNVLQNEIEVAQSFNPSSEKQPNLQKFTALWDTGATNSVISKNVVEKCNLKPIDMTITHTASGERHCCVYLVSIGLPNNILIPNLRVTDGILTGMDVLIGMDIISQGDFAVTNFKGKTMFSFGAPSNCEIDFNSNPSIGRNDLCP